MVVREPRILPGRTIWRWDDDDDVYPQAAGYCIIASRLRKTRVAYRAYDQHYGEYGLNSHIFPGDDARLHGARCITGWEARGGGVQARSSYSLESYCTYRPSSSSQPATNGITGRGCSGKTPMMGILGAGGQERQLPL